LHFGVLLCPKLGSLVSARLPAEVALVFAQALNLVDYDYTIPLPFSDGFYRASRNAGRLGTVVAGGGKEGNK
jgi:hypothetical protein